MATVTYKSFLPEVLPGMMSCPVAVAVNAVRNAAIEFCERSWSWRVNHTAVSVTGLTGKYAFVPPTDGIICAVLQVWYDGEPLVAKDIDWLHQTHDQWQAEIGSPEWYTREDEASITLVPYPGAAATNVLTMLCAAKPTRASTGCDSLLHENHLETISMGARSKLMLMDGKPWTNVPKGAAYKEQFEYIANGHRANVLKGLVRSRKRVAGVYF